MAIDKTVDAGTSPNAAPDVDERGPTEWQLALRELLKRPPALFGVFTIVMAILWALLPGLFSPLDPLNQDLERYLKPPGFVDAAGNTYWLGTDQLGRDIVSRVIWGARVSLTVGFAAVFISGFIGITMGLIAGYFGGKVDAVISRIVDAVLAIPFVLLAIAIIAILGASLQNIILAIALRTWTVYTRVVRGEVFALKETDMVTGAKAAGASTLRIMLIYILPNVFSSVIVVATIYLGRMIIIESSFSFLGMGVPPPTPTWGGMLADGRGFLDTSWWLTLFPGIALTLTVLGVNLLGDWLRDVLDPRMKRLDD
jgi:peptide/nickel transport system permease protein